MKIQCSQTIATLSLLLSQTSAFSGPFVPQRSTSSSSSFGVVKKSNEKTSLQMIDDQIIMGAGIAVAGVVAGIGLVSFTEQQGERGKTRGTGVSDNMATKLSGMLMEDVEVSSVDDIGSLTDQLEAALKASGGTDGTDLEMSEAEKKRIIEEADDGW